MKKHILTFILYLVVLGVKAQSCDGVPCIANPIIVQADIIECTQPIQDTLPWYCEEDECLDVCENTSNSYSTAYNAGSTYAWNIIGGLIINYSPLGNSVTVVWGTGTTGLLTVEELDVNSCDNLDVLCVNIKATPQPSIMTLPNSTVFCKDVPIKFEAIDLNPNQLIQDYDSCSSAQTWPIDSTQYYYSMHYLWDFGDGTTSVMYNPIHSYTTSGFKTITLIMSNNCQCSDTVSIQIEITNDVGPKVISCIGALCEGDTAQYCTDAITPNWVVEGGSLYYTTSTDDCINVIWDNIDNTLVDGEGTLIVNDLSALCGSGETYFSVPVLTSTPEITGKTTVCLNMYEIYSYECIPGVDYYWVVSGGAIVGGQNSSEIKVEWNYQLLGQVTLYLNSSTLDCNLGQTSINVDVLPRIEIWGSNKVCEEGSIYYTDAWWSNILEWSVINGDIVNPTSPPYITNQVQIEWDQGVETGSVIATATQSGIFCQSNTSYAIQVIEKPPQAISINGDSLICPGNPYLYTISETNANSSSNLLYQWTITGGTPSSYQGETCNITWDPVGSYSISVTNKIMTDPYCISDPLIKNINSVPIQNPVISGSSTACMNSVSTFNLNTIYPSWAKISWSVGNPNLGSVIAGQGNSQAQIEWGNQVGATDVIIDVEVCGITYSQNFPVTFTNPAISFSASSNPVCSETIVVFNSTGGLGTYNWDFGDGTPTSNIQNPNKSYDEPGNYLVHLTFTDAVNQCSSSYSTFIEIEGIAGNLLPEGTSLYCSSSNISQPLYITTISTSTPLIEWFHNATSISTSNTHTVSSNPPNQNGIGNYSVVLTDVNGCSNELNSINIDTVNCSNGSGGWSGGGGGACPTPLPTLPHTTNCNSNQGTRVYNFSSINGNILDWRVDNEAISSSLNYQVDFNKAGIYKVKCLSSGCLLGSQQITVPVVVKTDYSLICDPLNGNQITYFFEDRSSYLLGYGTATYNWDFGDGTPTSNIQNPNHVYAANGTYNINLTVNYGAYSCNKITTITVTDLNVTYSYSGLECENTPTITFTSVSSPTSIDSWNWVFGDGASSGSQTPRRTYSQSGLFITSLQITDINGCTVTETNPITIKQNPIINSVNNLGPFCSNDSSFYLSNTVDYDTINGEEAIWSGIGIEQDLNTLEYYFNPLLAGGGSYEICVTITDDSGCYVTECIMVDVICPEKPKVFGDSEFCSDYAYHSYTTQSGYSNYQWYQNGSPISWGGNFTNYSFYGSSTTDLTVGFTDNNGCTTISESFTVTVNPKPNWFFASVIGNLCPEQEITITHDGNESNVNYFWNTPEKHTTSTITITSESNYEYYVVATNQYGCNRKSNEIELHQAPNMCAVLSGCYCDSSILNNANTVNISGVSDSWLYMTEWLRNGFAMIPPVTSNNLPLDPSDPNYINLVPATFNQKVIDNSGCIYFSDDLILETNCSVCFEESYSDINDTICDGNTYVLGNNTYTTAGNHISYLTGFTGCDSIIEVDLFVKPTYSLQNPQTICDGEYYIMANNTYNTAGVYADVFIAENGCDSIIITNLTVNPLLTNIVNREICSGDSLFITTNYYTVSGVYTDTISNISSCDSVITTNLIVHPLSSSIDNVGAYCDTYTWLDGVSYTASNNSATWTTIDPITGCDNVTTLDLTINNSTTSIDNVGAYCDTYTWLDGVSYTASNNSATWTTTNAAGCDNVATLDLTINNSTVSSDNQVHCDIYTWLDGVSYTASNNSATWTTTDPITGCDNVATLNLTINNSTTSIDNVGAYCDTYTWLDGISYTASNNSATWTTTNAAGCNNVATLNLTINNSTASIDNQIICQGDSLLINQNIYTNPGTYIDILQNTNGCDSIITTNLSVTPSYYNTQYLQICEGDSVQVGQNYYSITGNYVDSLSTINTCDSIIYTDLSVDQPTATITANPPFIELNITNGTIPYSYKVGNQNGLILTSTNNFTTTSYFTPIINGQYYFIVIDSEGCISDTCYYDVTFLPTIIEEASINELAIFPNPSRNVFNITFISDDAQDLRVRILNVIGKELISDNLKQFIGEYTKQINLSDNAKGIYFLEIETNHGVINKKLILQ